MKTPTNTDRVVALHPNSWRCRKAETAFRLLADTLPEIAWAAHPDGRLDYYNDKWYKRTGATRGITGDESWLPILHPEDRQKCLDTWYESIKAARPFQLELRFRFPASQEYRWHLGRALPLLNEKGKVVRWFGTSTDVQDLRAANQEVIKDLAKRLITAQEQERERVGRELHDDVGQRLALLFIGLQELKQRVPAGMATLRTRFSRLLREADEISTSVHELSHQLHPSVLQYVGLKAALYGLCRRTFQRHHVRVDLDADADADTTNLSDEANLCLFRVAQEALNNSVKHGGAKRVMFQLRNDKGLLRMRIVDAGTGFDPAGAIRGLGILSMRERLRLVGGELAVKSRLGEGTEVIAELPIGALTFRLPSVS